MSPNLAQYCREHSRRLSRSRLALVHIYVWDRFGSHTFHIYEGSCIVCRIATAIPQLSPPAADANRLSSSRRSVHQYIWMYIPADANRLSSRTPTGSAVVVAGGQYGMYPPGSKYADVHARYVPFIIIDSLFLMLINPPAKTIYLYKGFMPLSG